MKAALNKNRENEMRNDMDKRHAELLNKVAMQRTKNVAIWGFYPGWAKDYVESERQILEQWRPAFYNELFSDDTEYRKELEASINWFGVRWS